jgi:superfamily II DNA or RNA helicase
MSSRTSSRQRNRGPAIQTPPDREQWRFRECLKHIDGKRQSASNSLRTVTKPYEPDELFDDPAEAPFELWITLDYPDASFQLEWVHTDSGIPEAQMRVRLTTSDELSWAWEPSARLAWKCRANSHAVRACLHRLRRVFPTGKRGVFAGLIPMPQPGAKPHADSWQPIDLPLTSSPWTWLEQEVIVMARELGGQCAPLGSFADQFEETDPARYFRRQARKAEKTEREAAEREALIAEAQRRQAAEGRRKESERRQRAAQQAKAPPPTAPTRPLLPPVPVHIEFPSLSVQDSLLPVPDLRGYFLQERAAQWWISNQSDDLLALPYCQIERLDYQLRTALRVIGPLRGRALLSDEVGLGKTIETGLVIKEYLTRGLVKRFLVLTVPSLVDQWEEELHEKFGLTCATTNQPAFRSDPAAFWRDNPFLIASLHTLKQPPHLAVAQIVHWDLLAVDEAHYLRNRTSQAWQAVNALPRHFLLLLTATPVQNSLEELYNLVTLLQPGQLPSPKEFRARFMDKAKPHQPREPEELRRLLGQVMIRNTRANAGIGLPPRRAETVLFDMDEVELAFWQSWENELRAHLARLEHPKASLWGRLLLQAAGSSPDAWRDALESFPAPEMARAWLERAPLAPAWKRKCELAVPLTRGEGGVVIFTQFLRTQAALAGHLRSAGVPVRVINGQTPPPARQPLTEEFRRAGGALLLTHSGTEGRNLQFCHRLINFDLPWNPMEIEQRIGRLHRLGQQQPVRIYNFVQKHTLQEQLLGILQDKLNLFELVVGETGLVLGERFSADEFAEEVLRRWREAEGCVGESFEALGNELAAARAAYDEVKQLDETLFKQDYETL